MHVPVREPETSSIIEVDAAVTTCVVDGCGGSIVRHSLGAAQSVHRCTRCFRRYQRRTAAMPQPSAFRRFVHDFVSWRDA